MRVACCSIRGPIVSQTDKRRRPTCCFALSGKTEEQASVLCSSFSDSHSQGLVFVLPNLGMYRELAYFGCPGATENKESRITCSCNTRESAVSRLTAKIKLREVGCLAQGHTAGTESTFLIPFTSVLFLHSPEHLTKTGP